MKAENRTVKNKALLELMKTLQEQATEGTELLWEKKEENTFTLQLPKFSFEITSDVTEGRNGSILVAATLPSNAVLASETLVRGDTDFEIASNLWDSASGKLDQTEALLLEGLDFVKKATGVIGGPPSPPAVPSGPSKEQVEIFFNRIKGNWDLDYERGKESLEIRADGKYFYVTDFRPRPVTQTIKPAFNLILLSCNDALSRVEIAKEELSGRVKQIEVLTVSDKEMVGYAKHDGHKLHYVRK